MTLVTALAACAAIQLAAFERYSDTRTEVPAALIARDELSGVDLSFSSSFYKGNVAQISVLGSASSFLKVADSTFYLLGSATYSTFNHETKLNQGTATL